MALSIPTITLNDGRAMPLLGLGTYKSTEKEVEKAIVTAAKYGYRLIDTASSYKNEDSIGRGIRASGIPRENFFITTKVWNTAQRVGDIEGAFNRSLDRLRLDYVDLYLIHWPVPGCYPETWRALEKIRESGRAKSIGVSNFEELHLTALFEFSGVIPAVNQIECHPLWNRKPLIAFCRSHGIAVQAYAPLARGLYLNREIMQQLAEKYVRTEAQIGLRYLIQQGISVIPKSTHPDRILPTRMSSTSNFLKPTWRSSTRWTNSSAPLPYRMTCCNCGFTEKAAQKICFFPFQISVLLFLFLFISRIPSSLLQVQIQSPIASASSKSCVTRSIVFSFPFLRI